MESASKETKNGAAFSSQRLKKLAAALSKIESEDYKSVPTAYSPTASNETPTARDPLSSCSDAPHTKKEIDMLELMLEMASRTGETQGLERFGFHPKGKQKLEINIPEQLMSENSSIQAGGSSKTTNPLVAQPALRRLGSPMALQALEELGRRPTSTPLANPISLRKSYYYQVMKKFNEKTVIADDNYGPPVDFVEVASCVEDDHSVVTIIWKNESNRRFCVLAAFLAALLLYFGHTQNSTSDVGFIPRTMISATQGMMVSANSLYSRSSIIKETWNDKRSLPFEWEKKHGGREVMTKGNASKGGQTRFKDGLGDFVLRAKHCLSTEWELWTRTKTQATQRTLPSWLEVSENDRMTSQVQPSLSLTSQEVYATSENSNSDDSHEGLIVSSPFRGSGTEQNALKKSISNFISKEPYLRSIRARIERLFQKIKETYFDRVKLLVKETFTRTRR